MIMHRFLCAAAEYRRAGTCPGKRLGMDFRDPGPWGNTEHPDPRFVGQGVHVVEILPEYSRVARHYLPTVDALRRAQASTTQRDDSLPSDTPVKGSRRALSFRLGPGQLDAIVARYEAGETTTALAREYAISHSSILRLFSQRGVQTRTRGLTPEKEREVIRLRAQGLIVRDVAKRIGCGYDTVRKFLLSTTGDNHRPKINPWVGGDQGTGCHRPS